jgi:hypothetical protein
MQTAIWYLYNIGQKNSQKEENHDNAERNIDFH